MPLNKNVAPNDKTAVRTGGTRGFGKALYIAFKVEGRHVVFADVPVVRRLF